ncbi:MAG: choice-of-anchor D domain-containing protein [Candidatus Kapabacteria bacterium]|nr:choice-of-anchor D domain-containing protein [Candidatus Kapabacteria bacterium]
MRYIILSFILLMSSAGVNSQTLDVFDIDASEFPIMKAKFFAFDSVGKQITDVSVQDFNIQEESYTRKILSVKCFTKTTLNPVSTILVMDASGSMRGRNLLYAKAAARAWIIAMPDGESESAITAFDDVNYLIQDFTSNKPQLLLKVEDLFIGRGTNYDAAFIDEMYGGLIISKNAKNKKILVLLTDGRPNFPPSEALIINEAMKQEVTIFAVTLGMNCPQVLKDITELTGGQWFENVSTSDEVTSIYNQILKIVQGVQPCEIIWESDYTCSGSERVMSIDYYPTSLNKYYSYTTPGGSVNGVGVSPESVFFRNVLPGTSKDSIITITANNGNMNVIDIVGTNPAFEIMPNSFKLNKGESKKVRMTYTAPLDVSYVWTRFDVINTLCPTQIFASAGFAGKKPNVKTLRLTNPNGGDKFVVGSDTVVSWVGIPNTDTVRLEYSYDNGSSWNVVNQKATDGSFDWAKIPKTPSVNCLMKVTQLKPDTGNNTEWAKNMGSDFFNAWEDKHSGIALDNSGNIYITGQYDGTLKVDGFELNSRGEEDIFVAKINTKGKVEWISSVGGTSQDIAAGLAVDTWGNIFVTGRFSQSIEFDTRALYSLGKSDVFLAKFLPDGSVEWAKNPGGTGDDFGNSVCVDTKGDIIVTGGFSQTSQFDNVNLTSAGQVDIFIAKYTPEGKMQWVKQNGGEFHDEGTSVTSDLTDRIFVTGKFSRKASFGTTILNSGGTQVEYADFDIFVAKYFPGGSMDWAVRAGGEGDDEGFAIAADTRGNAFLTGSFEKKAIFGDKEITANKSDTFGEVSDIFVANIMSDGKFYWAKRAGGNDIDVGYGIAVDVSDNAIVTGAFIGDADFDNTVITSKGFYDVFAAKYDMDGILKWARRAGGNYGDYGMSVALDSWGNAYIAGTFIFVADFGKKVLSTEFGNGDMFIWGAGGGDDGLQEDISDSVWAIVAPKAVSYDIDMGKVFIGSYRDSLITDYIYNSGLYKFRIDSIIFDGPDKNAFSVVSGETPYILENTSGMDVEFKFRPVKTGLNQANIKIYTQADTLIYKITGTGMLPDLQIVNSVIDFGKVLVGNLKDTLKAVTITNNGKTPIEIKRTNHNKPNEIDFTTLGGAGPFILNTGDTAKLDLRFKPSGKGRTNGVLEFHFEGIGSPAVVQLAGEGINPNPSILVSNNVFEELFCEKSTEAEILVSNIGGSKLEIGNIEFYGNNAAEFSIDESFPIIVDVDKTYRLKVNFNTDSPGLKTAEMKVTSNSTPDTIHSVPLLVKINGAYGLPDKSDIDYGILDLDEPASEIIKIKNTGNYASQFRFNITGVISLDIDSVYLNPSQSVDLTVSFNGSGQAAVIDDKITIFDSLCKTSAIIPVKGIVSKRDKPLITVSSGEFDEIVCNTETASEFSINNIGKEILVVSSLEIKGNDKNDFELAAPGGFSLNQGDSKSITVIFKPSGTGVKNAELVINSNSEINSDLSINITANSENAGFAIVEKSINLGNLLTGTSGNIKFKVTNSGTVANKFALSYSSSFDFNVPEMQLNSSQSYEFEGIYSAAQNPIDILESITVTDSICQQSASVEITGKVTAGVSYTLKAGSGEGNAGDRINIPVRINNLTNTDNPELTSINFDLSFNSTLLAPDFGVKSEISENNKRTLTFENVPVNVSENDLALNLPFIVGLGNKQTSELIISNVKSNNNSIIYTENGLFTFLGICTEGGARLVNPNGAAELMQINPNPADKDIILSVNLIEKGFTSVVIYNSEGLKCDSYEFNGEIGLKNINLKVSDYVDGLYFVHLHTPTVSEVQKFIIVK